MLGYVNLRLAWRPRPFPHAKLRRSGLAGEGPGISLYTKVMFLSTILLTMNFIMWLLSMLGCKLNNLESAFTALSKHLGFDLRKMQIDAILAVLNGLDVLVVLPTVKST